jgi:large subunit ribosomal protein L10
MLRSHKEEFVSTMKAEVAKAASVLFFDFTGLTVKEADSLRGKLRAAEVRYEVVKNTLMTRVLADTPFSGAAKYLKGTPTGVALSYEDPSAAAKVAVEFLKECQHIKVKGGVLDATPIGPRDVEALSLLPSRAQLQAAVVAAAMSPGRKLVSQVLSAGQRIAGVIAKRVEDLEASGS